MINSNFHIFGNNGNRQPEISCLIAKRGSGKTNVMLNYILQNVKNFNFILYYAPHTKSDVTLNDARHLFEKKGYNNIRITNNLNEVFGLLQKLNEDEETILKKKQNFLLVIDDSSSDEKILPPRDNKSELCKAIIGSRHLRLWVFLALHRYNTCPTIIRDLVDYTYMYKNNKKTLQKELEETGFDPLIVQELMKKYLVDPKDCLIFDHKKEDILFFNHTNGHIDKIFSNY
jgi:hypothetical protein